MNNKYNILYIESGTSGGGSFESLYQCLKGINRRRFRPVVVYLNNNLYIERVKALGTPVYLLTDRLYSNHVQYPRQGSSPQNYLKIIPLRNMLLILSLAIFLTISQ